ncbi:hypothetical protein [Streptomyces uncialis]|uniref:Carrier domain-containing protein n=1 Tax=Streptomyces uncialis TaxID=1048205 RepID=A0A1Q4V957_9ACTN|nr:hypothetical protein [Streptomyces uncialis]MCX4657998.1 acyl carrier protein [Streptomyces uncialis]OKH94381.1 hypothetical protein AB852_08630 [Streptomyces uncialis]WST66317.1 acyl carrier protein [Streptomyces uncialis]
MSSRSEVEATALRTIAEILEEDGQHAPQVSGASTLDGLGVTSLVLARVVIDLEDQLGVDPFRGGLAGDSPLRTVDDLIDAYTGALTEAGAQ